MTGEKTAGEHVLYSRQITGAVSGMFYWSDVPETDREPTKKARLHYDWRMRQMG